MNLEELSKLKQGDVVRHTDTGAGYIVLSNRAGVPTVVRTIEIHNAPEWEHVYTPTPVVVPEVHVSLVEKISGLEALGWKYDDTNDRWYSPDGKTWTSTLRSAWESRNNHSARVFSFAQARAALRAAGWINPYGKMWRAPSGCFFEGARAAYAALTSGGNLS